MKISLTRITKLVLDSLRAAILPGLLGGAFAAIMESLVVSAISGVVWTSYGLYYYPLLGLLVSLFCSGVVSVMFGLFTSNREIPYRQPLYFSAAAIFLIFPILPFLILDKWLNTVYTSILSILIIFAVLTILLAITLAFQWAFRFLAYKVKLGWRIGGVLVSLFAYAVLIGLSMAYPLDVVDLEPYDKHDASRLTDSPNIILILIDTLRPDCISPHGCEINTPVMQEIADNGVKFTHSFNNVTWTKPSIASILTSLHPYQHGIEDYTGMINPGSITLAQVLSDMGYYTVTFQNNPHINTTSNFHLGFNIFKIRAAKYYHPKLPNFRLSKRHDETVVRFAKYLYPPIVVNYFYDSAEILSDKAINWIKGNRDKKFFMYLHYMDPHDPYFEHPYTGYQIGPPSYGRDPDVPSEEKLNELWSLYRGEVEYVDMAIGKLIDYLKKNGMYDDALVIVTSDHGEEFYDHGGWGHGTNLYDEQLHQVLLFKLPDSEMKGTVDSSLAESIDIAPTIVGCVDGEVPAQWSGRDLFEAEPIRWTVSQIGLPKYQAEGIRSIDEKLWFNSVQNGKTINLKEYFDLKEDTPEQNDLSELDAYEKRVTELEDTLSILKTGLTSSAIEASKIELDEATREQLKALGYID